ncbi:MAG: adenosylcobinamide-GDP ribazoletransferase, partial [Hyphomicrobium sp.]
MIEREWRLFLVALQFLTRIPVGSFDGFDPAWLDRAAKYFPLVGALVGAIAAAV